MLSVLCYWGTPAVFVAYGVAMTGIGMLTLTGNTISMDVFGPVADNANGIGEMGYNRDGNGQELKAGEPEYMPPADYKRARQILADLDAVGNTTKAETKGIAIGSAVIAAVSLFASFIAVIAVGSEDKLSQMTTAQYNYFSGFLTVADPKVLIGLLIGGAVPFLFSSMLIRAVGRAAFFIVKECRMQFKDPAIMAGTKKPNYGRVVDICTSTAQKELIGPGILAILAPFAVGFLLGPYALGGFLAGMILVGPAPGRIHGQRRRRLGQRQEDDRGRHLRRQGHRGPQGQRHRRYGRRSLEGHRRPGHQPDGQGDEHGQPAGAGTGAGLQRGGRAAGRGQVQPEHADHPVACPTCPPIGTSAWPWSWSASCLISGRSGGARTRRAEMKEIVGTLEDAASVLLSLRERLNLITWSVMSTCLTLRRPCYAWCPMMSAWMGGRVV